MSSFVNDFLNRRTKKKEKEIIDKKEPDDFTSFIEGEDFLAEQVYNENGEVYFCIYNTKTLEITYETRVFKDGLMYAPIIAEEVTKKFIKLPNKAEEYESDEKLDEEISKYITKWLDIPALHKKYAVYNIKRSWVYDRFNTLNYLKAQGDYGTGKSRYLDVLGFTHYKPIATSGATTTSPIYRIINKWKGTLIIDEADLTKSDEAQDLIKIINQGYEKNRPVIRCNKENNFEPVFFDVFCPKIIATRKEFQDKATESRCMTTIMKQTNRKDIPATLNKDFELETQRIRNKLLMWRFRNYYKIDVEAGSKIDLGNIEPRLRQVNEGFVSMFANNPTEINRFKQYLQEYQNEQIETNSNTKEGMIVKAIAEIFISDDLMTAENIINKAELKDIKGNLINPRKLSKDMKTLGFEKTQQQWKDGKNNKVYPINLELLKNLVFRYVSDEELRDKITIHLTNLTNITDTVESPKTLNDYTKKDTSTYSVSKVRMVSKLVEVKTDYGSFKRIDFTHLPCYNCGATHSDGWSLENLKDGSIWCDVCAGIEVDEEV